MLLNLGLIILASCYYLLFINKGIVVYDEGYYAHFAERILQGETPFKDFFIQFPPGYFYLLAIFYKVFGATIISGRILTFIICLGIVYLTLLILDHFKADTKLKLISLLAVISFGFPLINNMAMLAWISVLLSLAVTLTFIKKRYTLLAILLSLFLFTKQNLGIYFFILTNVFVFLQIKGNVLSKLKPLVIINSIVVALTFTWVYYFFFIQSNTSTLFEFLTFNNRYLSVYTFSYPPLSFLTDPIGIFKLLPYYLPIIFLLFLIRELFKKTKKNLPIFFFCFISLSGFFGTVFPTSDLLHVYPFFGSFLVSSLIFFREKKFSRYWRLLVLILIGIGFYLTLFREYYRYQIPYSSQKTHLVLPKTQGIVIDEPLAEDLSILNLFLLVNTKKEDYIFSYPFSPMLYFIFERPNPSRFASYYPGYLTKKQEEEVINDIRFKKVKFIITFLEYKFDTPISKFIQKQELVLTEGQFKVLKIN